MAYCTQQHLTDRYGETEILQLTDREHTGAINTVRLAEAIDDAAATIDSYLGGRYALPINPVPLILERLASKLTWLILLDNNNQLSDSHQRQLESLKKTLREIGAGVISLGVDASGGAPESNNTATIVSGGNVFSRKDKSFI